MSREDKLKKLKESKAAKDMVIISNGEPFINALSDKIKDLKSALGVGVEINNVDDLVDQLSRIESFQKEVNDLRDAIKAIDVPKNIKIDGLDDLVKATKTIANKKDPQPIIQKIDISVLENVVNGVGNLIDKVEQLQVPKQGQEPSDYVPMRRVMKVGNKLMYDDSFYTGGGGGGGSSTTASSTSGNVVITDAGGEAATVTGGKLDVNATASLSGDAVPVAGAATAVSVQIVDGSGNQIASFGGGTQYTENATDASITGTVAMMEVAADTIEPIQGTVADGLLVNLGSNNDVIVTGTVTADLGATDNAVLDAIAASTAAIDTDATTIIGHVDGIETALTAANASLDAIEASTAAIDTDTTTIIGHLDGVEGLLTTIDADTGNMDTSLNNIETSAALLDDTVTTLGTDTYTEATSKGITIGAVRRDADTTLVNTTNEFTPLQVDANGRLKVEAFSGETLPVSLTSTTVTGTVAVSQSGTWDEVGINDSGNSITVDYATTGSGTATGALRVELPTNGTGTVGLNAGTNNIGDVDVLTLPVAFNSGAASATTQRVITATDAGAAGRLAANSGVDIGDVDVTSISAGTNLIGDVGVKPRTTGGLTTYHLVSGASTNAANIKASAGQLFGWYIYNSNAAARKVAFHNTAGTPTAGASVFFSIVIPPTSGANVFGEIGIAFSTGIGITTVTGLADSDSTGVAANDLIINLFYA